MEGIKGFFLIGLAAVGAYAVFNWWQTNPSSAGSSNPAASEVAGVAHSNMTNSSQMTSGIPGFNEMAIANGHGDQVSAAFHSNHWSTSNGSMNYTPAFGPKTNR